MDYDVALLELAVPAPMSYTIQSVCLPSPVHRFLKNAECFITGWGSTREGGERCSVGSHWYQKALYKCNTDMNKLKQTGQLEIILHIEF